MNNFIRSAHFLDYWKGVIALLSYILQAPVGTIYISFDSSKENFLIVEQKRQGLSHQVTFRMRRENLVYSQIISTLQFSAPDSTPLFEFPYSTPIAEEILGITLSSEPTILLTHQSVHYFTTHPRILNQRLGVGCIAQPMYREINLPT